MKRGTSSANLQLKEDIREELKEEAITRMRNHLIFLAELEKDNDP